VHLLPWWFSAWQARVVGQESKGNLTLGHGVPSSSSVTKHCFLLSMRDAFIVTTYGQAPSCG
jgi:hypothetical protein